MALDLNGKLGVSVDVSQVSAAIKSLKDFQQEALATVGVLDKLSKAKTAPGSGGGSSAGNAKKTNAVKEQSDELSRVERQILKLEETFKLVFKGYALGSAKAVASIRTIGDATEEQKAKMERLLSDAGNLDAGRKQFERDLKERAKMHAQAIAADIQRETKRASDYEKLLRRAYVEEDKILNKKSARHAKAIAEDMSREAKRNAEYLKLLRQAELEDLKISNRKDVQHAKALAINGKMDEKRWNNLENLIRKAQLVELKALDDLSKKHAKALADNNKRDEAYWNNYEKLVRSAYIEEGKLSERRQSKHAQAIAEDIQREKSKWEKIKSLQAQAIIEDRKRDVDKQNFQNKIADEIKQLRLQSQALSEVKDKTLAYEIAKKRMQGYTEDQINAFKREYTALKQLEGQVTKTGESLTLTGRIMQNVNKIAYNAAAFAFGFSVYNAIGTAIRSFIDGAKQLDQVSVSLITATGSATAAEAQYARLSKTAERLALPIFATAKGFAEFTISARGSGLSADQLAKSYDNLLVASAGSGVGLDEFQGILKAIIQIMSKGKVQAEELRGQLGDRLPGAVSIAARSMNMDMKTFDKAMKDGKIAANDFVIAFTQGMADIYAATAELRKGTVTGAIQNLKNQFAGLMKELDNRGATDAVSAGINKTADAVKYLSDNLGTITNVVKTILGLGAVFLAAAKGGAVLSAVATGLSVAFSLTGGIVLGVATIIGGLVYGVYKAADALGLFDESVKGQSKRLGLNKQALADQSEGYARLQAAMADAGHYGYDALSKLQIDANKEIAQSQITLNEITRSVDVTAIKSLADRGAAVNENSQEYKDIQVEIQKHIVSMKKSNEIINQATKFYNDLGEAQKTVDFRAASKDGMVAVAEIQAEIAAYKEGADAVEAFETRKAALSILQKKDSSITFESISSNQALALAYADVYKNILELNRVKKDYKSDAKSTKKEESELAREAKYLNERIELLKATSYFLGKNLDLEDARYAAQLKVKGNAKDELAYALALENRANRAKALRVETENDIKVQEKQGAIIDELIRKGYSLEKARYAANLASVDGISTDHDAEIAKRALNAASADTVRILNEEIAVISKKRELLAQATGSGQTIDTEELQIRAEGIVLQQTQAEIEARINKLKETRLEDFDTEIAKSNELMGLLFKFENPEVARVMNQRNLNAEQATSIVRTQQLLDMANELADIKFDRLRNPFAELASIDLGSIFGKGASQIDAMVDSMGELAKATYDVDLARKNWSETDERRIEAERKYKNTALGTTASLLSSGKKLFKEKSSEYKALAKAEKVLSVLRIAEAVKTSAVQISSALSVGLANATAAVAGAAIGIGPSGFVTAAAMAGLMAAIGFGGLGGGGSYSAPVAGTGTVLGDPTAQDQSITNANELLVSIQSKNLNVSYQMLATLRQIANGFSGVTNLLFQNNRDSGGATAFSGFQGSSSQLSGSIVNPVGAVGNKLIGANPITGILDKVTGGIASGLVQFQAKLFSTIGKLIFSKKTKMIDEGVILAAGQSLSEVMSSGLEGVYFATIETTKKVFGLKVSKKISDKTSPLQQAILKQFEDIITGIASVASEGLKFLGASQSQIDSAFANIDLGKVLGKISFKDKTDEDITKELNAAFSGLGSTIVETVLPGIIEFQKVGEGAFETLVRVVSETTAMKSIFDALGSAMNTTGIEAARITTAISDIFGGFDNAAEALTNYADFVLTDAEKTAALARQLDSLSGSLGAGQIRSADDLRALIDPILKIASGNPANLTEEQKTILAALPQLTGLTSALVDSIKSLKDDTLEKARQEAEKALTDATNELRKSYDKEKSRLTEIVRAFTDIANSLRTFRDSIMKAADSPEATYQKARDEFLRVSGLASQGDVESLKKLDDVGQAFLDASKDYNATSSQFFADQQVILNAVNSSIVYAEDQLTTAEMQLQALDSQVGLLIELNETVLSIDEAILKFVDAKTAVDALSSTNAVVATVTPTTETSTPTGSTTTATPSTTTTTAPNLTPQINFSTALIEEKIDETNDLSETLITMQSASNQKMAELLVQLNDTLEAIRQATRLQTSAPRYI